MGQRAQVYIRDEDVETWQWAVEFAGDQRRPVSGLVMEALALYRETMKATETEPPQHGRWKVTYLVRPGKPIERVVVGHPPDEFLEALEPLEGRKAPDVDLVVEARELGDDDEVE